MTLLIAALLASGIIVSGIALGLFLCWLYANRRRAQRRFGALKGILRIKLLVFGGRFAGRGRNAFRLGQALAQKSTIDEFDNLVTRMQSPESKHAMRSLFSATLEKLTKARLEGEEQARWNRDQVLSAARNALEFWNIALADRLAILGCDQKTYDRWAKTGEAGVVSQDNLIRVSTILAIWKNLQIVLPEAHAADTWIHSPNSGPPFDGKTPLSLMTRGELAGLIAVRFYLDGMAYNA